jgi:sarcosine oxidase subunit beta
MSARFHSSLDDVRGHDVVILGAGIVGLMTALMFNRKGIVPLLIERMPAPASLTSRRSGEGVRAQWELVHNIDIARRSIGFYKSLSDELGLVGATSGYRPVGYLYGSRTEAGADVLRNRVARQQAAGLDDVELMDGYEARRRFPLLADDTQAVAFRQNDGVIEIESVLSAVLASLDADVLLGVEAGDIAETTTEVSIQSSAGTIHASTLVIANGTRLGATIRKLGASLSVRSARSTIVRLKTGAVPEDHPATIDVDHGSFWRPDVGGARMTATFRGNLFVEDDVDDPPLDRDYLAAALSSVWHLVPQWRQSAPLIGDYHMRSGTFAVTEDGAPVIGTLPGFRNIFVNGGYGGHGVMMSPDGARRLVESVLDPGMPNAFHPSRFTSGQPVQPEPMTVHLHGTAQE